jgi:RNA polymerase sigma-70 factor (ECF subfamily)
MSTSKPNSTPLDFNDALIKARPLVLAVIHRTGIRDRATAEDIAQDAFIKAWQASEGFNAKSKVSSWLCAIAKNAAIDHMRKHRRMIMLGDNAIPEKGDSSSFSNPLAKMLEVEHEASVKDEVQTALSKLSPKHAEVVRMYHIEDMSYENIALTLNIPRGSVMSRLFHARKKMRTFLNNPV